MVENLPAMKETRIQSQGQEVPLEMGMVTHPSILVWRIQFHGHRSLAGYSPWDCEESDKTEQLTITICARAQSCPSLRPHGL